MTPELLRHVEQARQAGATVILKWDGDRQVGVCTVLITHQSSEFHFRKETDDPLGALIEGLAQFRELTP